MKSELIFQSSPYLIFACIFLGGLYAYILYSKKSTISTKANLLLSALRGITVSILSFLLLNIFIKSKVLTEDKPLAVIAIDNSSSLKNLGLNLKIEKLITDLKETGRDIQFEYLDKTENLEITDLKYNQKISDLNALLSQVKSNFDGRNLTDVVLISDGIVNAGISPTFKKYNFKIHTVGVGDTTQKKDVRLASVFSNKLTYVGNKFPIQVDVNSLGFSGKQTSVLLKDGNEIVDKQVVNFAGQNDVKTISLYATAKTVGLKKYTVEVLPISGESSTINNKRDLIVEVINGKEKILIVGLTPHPDIKAIKSIMDKNELYETQVQLLTDIENFKIPEFDILILHQLPDIQGLGQTMISNLMAKNKPTFFVIASQTNIPSLNGYNQVMGIALSGNQVDNVSGKYNENFKMFNFDSEKAKILEKLPPIRVPFGEFRLSKGAEILLYQKISNITTNKPLLAINTNGLRKVAIFTGEGIWQWRLEEFALTDKQEVLDDLFLKTIQLLSVKEDKRKLQVNTAQIQHVLGEKIIFQSETYNNIYEKIYDQTIKLTLMDAKGKKFNYEYVNSSQSNSFEVSDLPAGDYSYVATSKILGKDENTKGQFFITDVDIEMQDLTADWNLLRTIAQKNDGKFFEIRNTSELVKMINSKEAIVKISSKEEMNESINLKYLFFLFLILISLEWGIRKFLGTY